MRLEEIEPGDAAQHQAKAMKASAKVAKDRAGQLQNRADMSAERVEMQKSNDRLINLQRKAVSATIKSFK